MIPVTQSFMPPIEEYYYLVNKLWNTKWLTNNGEYSRLLEEKLKNYLNVPVLHFVSNGTIALQIALSSLEIKNEVITTPFSFAATTNSILWEKCKPIFVDIDPTTLCIDTNKIEEAISDKTEAILATHVYGIPCEVDKIKNIALKHNLKVIYDAAHAFGVKYKNRSLLEYGDISTLSFHATKLFHTVEGGGVINNCGFEIDKRINLLRNFGIYDGKHYLIGINGKNSEFHAAMGLCNLKYVDAIIKKRKDICLLYDSFLLNSFQRPKIPNQTEYNYSYYPIIFETENHLLYIKEKLEKHQIYSRRYFFPSLNKLSYLSSTTDCNNSESISKRVLCIPLYSELGLEDAEKIAKLIMEKR